jgi:diaminopimelate decarboxylase
MPRLNAKLKPARRGSAGLRNAMLASLSEAEVRGLHELHAGLCYVRGTLQFDGLDLAELYERHRVPLLVFSERRLRDNVACTQAAYASTGRRTAVSFPLKSCYLRGCVDAIRDAGAGAEVMSAIELQLALAYGFAPESIIANGPAKSEAYLECALRAGIGLIIVDSCEDLERLIASAERLGVVPRVGLRITAELDPTTQVYIRAGHKLGFTPGHAGFRDALLRARESRWCDLVALHTHQLSHCVSPQEYRAMLRGFVMVVLEVYREYGIAFRQLDLGGGLDARFLLQRAGETLETMANAAATELDRIPYPFELLVEPGRMIAADAAVGVTRAVADRTRETRPWRFTELGSNVLIPLPEIAYYPIPTRIPATAQPWKRWHVADATCAPSMLCRDVCLPTGPTSDVLAVLNCGAYTTVFAELWAFRLPRILFLRSNGEVEELFGDDAQRRMYRAYYGVEVEV